MKHLLTLIALLVTFAPAIAQTLDDVLAAIERNNTTLQALRKSIDAEQLGNRAELSLPDPEVGFNYLWGTPSEIGPRKDITVTQQFDAATLTGQKRRVARSRNEALEQQYRIERMQLLLDARQQLFDLIYYNAMLALSEQRLADADTLLTAQQRRLDAGDGTLLDLNNARLSHAALLTHHQQLQAERTALLAQLQQLNGGQDIPHSSVSALRALHISHSPLSPLPDFESWYAEAAAHSPILAEAAADVELSRHLLRLSRTECLPGITLGYMSEKTDGEHYQGITAGISIPLWSGRRKIRQAKASIAAAEARQQDAALQFRSQLQALHQRALALQHSAATYRAALTEADNTPLLRRALLAGQISLPEYLQQIALIYDAQDQVLATERDYQHALAALTAYTSY